MPYRRLPNTDSTRLKAMEDAMAKSNKVSPSELAFSQKSLQRLRYFLPSYKQALTFLKDAQKRQVEQSANYHELQKSTKLYISHFIQVLNLAIIRGEINEDVRTLYGLENYDKRVPSLSTEQEITEWGKKIIDGETARMTRGGAPLMNPKIALVRIKYEQFLEAFRTQKFNQNAYKRSHDKVMELRPEADAIILEIWNEVELKYENESLDEKRRKSSEYGVHYVMRPSEIEV